MVNHPNKNPTHRLSPHANEIRKMRLKYNLDQKEFGDLISASTRAVQAWEAGDRNMHPVSWYYLLHILGESEIPFGTGAGIVPIDPDRLVLNA